MTKKIIKLSSQEDLKIFMSPQRQKLIRNMQISGEAVTPKTVADMLGVSSSSAQFHIKKLEKLGIVELDHTKSINGITAKYYKLVDADVHIGSTTKDGFTGERIAIMQNLMKDTFDGLIEFYDKNLQDEAIAKNGDFLNGVLHLTETDSRKLLKMIRGFVSTHEQKSEHTSPWEYTFILYNSEAENK